MQRNEWRLLVRRDGYADDDCREEAFLNIVAVILLPRRQHIYCAQ